jgi:hypothetical protein
MPRVYRLETEDGHGAYKSGAVSHVEDIAHKHGRQLYADMPPGSYVPGFRPGKHFFGFKTIKQYEWWTAHEEVRQALVSPMGYDQKPLAMRFAVYEVPSVIATQHQAVFDRSKAKLVEARSPATPRKRNPITTQETASL